jgi:N-acetylmuramoyl-L-alanine amidase
MKNLTLYKLFSYALALILICTILIPTNSNANGEEVLSTVSSLNMRSGPGLAYPIITSLQKGDRMIVTEIQDDWLKVTKDQHSGWVASWYTKKIATEKKINQAVISKVDRLNIRSQPTIDAATLGQLSTGDQASFISDQGDWVEIAFNQVKGFVSKEYITVSTESKDKPKTAVQSPTAFEVSVDRLNVRSKPDLTSEKLSQIKKGERFKILEKRNNWVNIALNNKESGWVYSFYGTYTELSPTSTKQGKDASAKTVTIVYNGTNLRSDASSASEVIYRANAGETFSTNGQTGDWYKVTLNNGNKAYVANWVVSSNQKGLQKDSKEKETTRNKGTLNGLTIVIDPGHGGNDNGTTGARGTDEKGIALQTSELLSSKLRAAGANVVMTRDSDIYVDLRKRVSIGHQLPADAFISIHYDATDDSSINGFTTYYMHGYQKSLAKTVHAGLSKKISLRDRGAQPGNYLVLRENRQEAILIELGFLSNPSEERSVSTNQFREQASLGIYNGVVNYFDSKLK